MVMGLKDNSASGHIINGSVTRAATQHSRLCLGQKDHMVADAHGVLVHGVELAHSTWQEAVKLSDAAGVKPNTLLMVPKEKVP